MKFHSSDRIKIAPGFWSGLEQLGIAPVDVACKAALPLSAMAEGSVTAPQYFAIWQAYSDLADDVAGGIVRLATAYDTAHYPPAVLATYHARDYRDALRRMVRYKQMCPPEKLRMKEESDVCIIELDWQSSEQAGPPMLIGITLVWLLELGRRGTGKRLEAWSVEFAQKMGNAETLQAFFGCDVKIGAKHNRLTLNRSDLDLPFRSYNEDLLQILTPVLDRSLEEQREWETGQNSIAEKVKWIMKRVLSAGRPDVQTIARELGMSDRTLQRRLADENASFKQLLTQVRHEQARTYLADPALDIKEVAFLTGYEDQNSFYRAFRSWEGETPANWRLKQERWRNRLVT